MFITGPNVIETVLGEKISQEELGGAKVHAEITGNAHFYAKDEKECFQLIQKLLSFLPANNNEQPQTITPQLPKESFNIENIIPNDPKQPYDVKEIIKAPCHAKDIWSRA